MDVITVSLVKSTPAVMSGACSHEKPEVLGNLVFLIFPENSFFLMLLQVVSVKSNQCSIFFIRTPATGPLPASQLGDKGTKFSTGLYLLAGFLWSDEVHIH